MHLKLNGVLSSVNTNGFLIGGDHESYEKVVRLSNSIKGLNPIKPGLKVYIHCSVFKQPTFLSNQGLCSAINQWVDFEGKKAEIKVLVKKYSFHSKFEYNKDELVQGFKLVLCELNIIQ